MKKQLSRLKIVRLFQSLLIFFLFFNGVESNTQVKTTKNVIYGQDSISDARIKGEIVGDPPDNLTLYAFLIKANSQISKEFKALIAPNYQTPIINGQFSLPFVQSGQYLVGVFADRIKNSLLDLYDDPYWFAPDMPVNLKPEEVYNFKINISKQNWSEIELKNFPQKHSLLLQLGSSDGSPLFLMQIDNNPFKVKGIQKPFGFFIIVDENENEIVDPSEQTKKIYWTYDSEQSNFTVEYGKLWNPLQLYFKNGPFKPKLSIHRIVNKTPEKLIPIPNFTFIDSNNLIMLPHVESGEYQLIIHPNPDSAEIKGPTYIQQRDNQWQLEVSEKYTAEFNYHNQSEPSYFQFFMDGIPVYNCEAKSTVNLYQPGQYQLIWYSNRNRNSQLKLSRLENKIHDVSNFELTQKDPSRIIKLGNQNNKIKISGTYNWMHDPPPQVHLHFFQKSDIEGYWNSLFQKITSASEPAVFNLSMTIDPAKELYVHLDLNRNNIPENEEIEFSQLIDPKQLQIKNNRFQFPVVYKGILKLLVSGPKPDQYFLEIMRPPDEEIIGSAFLNEGLNTFKNLPLGYQLKLNMIHDVNANKRLDSNDIIIPTKKISIDLISKELILPIDLEKL